MDEFDGLLKARLKKFSLKDKLNSIKDILKALLKEETDNTFIQFIRYVAVGGAATVFDVGTFYLMNLAAGVHYIPSNVIAFITGLTINYILSSLWVFNPKETSLFRDFMLFSVIGVVGLMLSNCLLHIFIDRIGLVPVVSKLFATAIVLVWNFVGRKTLVYRQSIKIPHENK